MRCSVNDSATHVRGILRRLPTSTLMGLAFTLPAMLISGLVLFYHSLGARRFLADEGVRYGDMLADQLLSASQHFLRLGSLSAVQEMIEETGSKRSVLAVALIGKDGKIIASNKRGWIWRDAAVGPGPDFTAIAAAARATARVQHPLGDDCRRMVPAFTLPLASVQPQLSHRRLDGAASPPHGGGLRRNRHRRPGVGTHPRGQQHVLLPVRLCPRGDGPFDPARPAPGGRARSPHGGLPVGLRIGAARVPRPPVRAQERRALSGGRAWRADLAGEPYGDRVDLARYDRTTHARGPAAPGAEDGERRDARRGHRARFQQSPDRDPRIHASGQDPHGG